MIYSAEQFEADLQKIGPRPFDIYALGPLLIYFAFKGKKPLGRWSRRILFTAGLYTIFRNWQNYKSIPQTVSTFRDRLTSEATDDPGPGGTTT